jgi:hypothetical protein
MALKTGRRDSIVSLKKSADDGIPTPQTDVTSLLAYFKKIGLNTAQTVALLGNAQLSPQLLWCQVDDKILLIGIQLLLITQLDLV